MAWLEQDSHSARYKVCFRFGGKRFKRSTKTTDRKEAEAIAGGVERTLLRIEQGLLQLPPTVDLLSFVFSDGNQAEKPKIPTTQTLGALREQFLQVHALGAMEQNSLDTVKVHLKHCAKTFGERFPMQSLTLGKLQQHVDRRAKEKGTRNRALSPATIRKEIATLRGLWNWAVQSGFLNGVFPSRGLKYPKTRQKPEFQTWEEIERQIARGVLSPNEEGELWDLLFLRPEELEELLCYVRTHARHPFLYPLFAFAAHTGARRSEMMRSRITDVDLVSNTVVIREKKRVRGQESTRRVPLSPVLIKVMGQWLQSHPGGSFTFCLEPGVGRSRKKREFPSQLTRDEAHDHFKRTLSGSKWERLRGWHIFRHSFISICAAAGVDQRMIDSWVGHQTEQMRQRYRHLFPNHEQTVIKSVFG